MEEHKSKKIVKIVQNLREQMKSKGIEQPPKIVNLYCSEFYDRSMNKYLTRHGLDYSLQMPIKKQDFIKMSRELGYKLR